MFRAATMRLAVFVTIVGLFLSACGSGNVEDPSQETAAVPETSPTSAPADETIPVTLVAELTGPGSTGVFLSTANGAQAAFANVNSQGGVHGRRLDVAVIDSMSTVDGVLAATEAALSDEPVAMIYGTISTSTGAAAPRLESAGIPVVFAGPFDEALYPTPKPYAFTTFPTNRQQVAGLLGGADLALEGLEGRRLAVVVGRTAAWEAQVDLIEQVEEDAGFEIAMTEFLDMTATDFTAQAANVARSEPDAVILSTNPALATLVSQALADAGFEGHIIATQSTAQNATFEEIRNPKYLAYRDVQVPDPDGELARVAADTGFAEGIESAFWTGGYVNATVLIHGLERCGPTCTSDALIEHLENAGEISVPSTFGPFSFSSDKHHGATSVQFYGWNATGEAIEAVGEPVDISNE